MTRFRLLAPVVLVVGVLVGACGSSSGRPLAGQVRDPAPVVADLTLPAADGTDYAFRAAPGELLLVYFGYTSCPDVCPTTLSDLGAAVDRLDPTDADRVHLAMATIDPDRDRPERLAAYVNGFLPGSTALQTDDAQRLREIADAFGARYTVTTKPDGTPEVSHSAFLYAVDDTGRLVLQWPFGTKAADLSQDLRILLDRIDRQEQP